MPYLQNSNNLSFKESRENQQMASKLNKPITKPTWVNSFIGTCLEDIANKYQHSIDENIGIFQKECIDYLNQKYGHSKIENIRKSLNFTIVQGWSHDTFIWQMIYHVTNVLRPLQEEEKKDAEISDLINQLQAYGLYPHFNIEHVKKHSVLHNQHFNIENLKKELQECKNAEFDSQKILNDEYHLNYLVATYLGGYSSEDYKKYSRIAISQATRKLIQPELDRRIMERKIDMEARHRINKQKELQKQLEEKQIFEDAVQKRMEELLNQ